MASLLQRTCSPTTILLISSYLCSPARVFSYGVSNIQGLGTWLGHHGEVAQSG